MTGIGSLAVAVRLVDEVRNFGMSVVVVVIVDLDVAN